MKALQLLVTIGELSLSHKGIKNFSMERNFADISNTFSLTIIDSYDTAALDLELYMNAGYRNIKITYYDENNTSNMLTFEGNIWDYTTTLVGNLKELTLTGLVSKAVGVSISGEAKYNIDFNNYYNLRVDETKLWGALDRVQNFYNEYLPDNTTTLDDGTTFYRSPAAWSSSQDTTIENAVYITLTGPTGGSIKLPIPDSFFPFVQGSKEISTEDPTEAYYSSGDDSDGPWGRLFEKEITFADDPFAYSYWYEAGTDPEIVRAFSSPLLGGETYLQAHPSKEYYGAGTFLYDGMGVRPSEIIKKLATLEGWTFNDSNIVDTEYVPCSDAFKMQNMTALEFIQKVLVPVSVTPTGTYTLAEDYYDSKADKQYPAGSKITLTKGYAGFVPYFKNNQFYYEPLNSEMLKTVHSYNMDYNAADSNVISFQVNTKGTAFYTEQAVALNTLSIVTGQSYEEIQISSPTFVDEYNKVSHHNENLDNFFGYTYEEINNNLSNVRAKVLLNDVNNSALDAWFTAFTGGENIEVNNYGSYNSVISSVTAINNNLITVLPSSGTTSGSLSSINLTSAYEKIKQFTVTASMAVYGNTKLNPGDYVEVNIYLNKITSETKIHPASGKYLILSQQESISDSEFVQTLSLLRASDLEDQISPQKIDWSKSITTDKTDDIVDNR